MKVLDIANKIHLDLPYAAVTKTRNKYRYLSGSDIQNCDSTDEKLLCQKRLIEISPKQGCSVNLDNCEKWADILVHDITNSDIILIMKEELNATLTCKGKDAEQIGLPRKAIMTLSLNCDLTTDKFQIHRLSYRHLHDTEQVMYESIKFDITQHQRILKADKALSIHETLDKTRLQIAKLLKSNEDFRAKVDSQIVE